MYHCIHCAFYAKYSSQWCIPEIAMRGMILTGSACMLAAVFCQAGATNEQAAPITGQTNTSVGTTSSTLLPAMTITGDLDRARDQIAPDLGAVSYTIGPNQIKAAGQGENSSFQQVLLRAPGVVQDEFGEVHIRGDHGDVQYRVNGVLLPESLNGFGQEIDPHLIN